MPSMWPHALESSLFRRVSICQHFIDPLRPTDCQRNPFRLLIRCDCLLKHLNCAYLMHCQRIDRMRYCVMWFCVISCCYVMLSYIALRSFRQTLDPKILHWYQHTVNPQTNKYCIYSLIIIHIPYTVIPTTIALVPTYRTLRSNSIAPLLTYRVVPSFQQLLHSYPHTVYHHSNISHPYPHNVYPQTNNYGIRPVDTVILRCVADHYPLLVLDFGFRFPDNIILSVLWYHSDLNLRRV